MSTAIVAGNVSDYKPVVFRDEAVPLLDPSELYRPENKKMDEFRKYTEDFADPIQKRVWDTYKKMHTFQTVEFVQEKMAHWSKFDKARMTIMEGLELLNRLVDESDPDVDVPNIVHAFQTAERIRSAHPDMEWFHLTGLVHDLGKVMALYGEPQWCVVGDTFPVGCGLQDSIVYRDSTFSEYKDLQDPRYNTKLGMYKEHCGLDNVMMSWGHDEYMYQFLLHNKTTLPEEALYVIRFHSFYPWHTGGDYGHLMNDKDHSKLKWIKEFNKFDLYSKSHEVPDIEALMPYYQALIGKYIPGILEW